MRAEVCAFCDCPIFGGPGGWHDETGHEVCPSGALPNVFHEPRDIEAQDAARRAGHGATEGTTMERMTEREPCPHPFIDGDQRKLFEGVCPRCDVQMERHDEYGRCPCCDIRLSASGDKVVMHLEFDVLAVDDEALKAGDRLKFIRKIDDDGDWKQPNA